MLCMTEQTEQRVDKIAHELLQLVLQFRPAPIRFGSKAPEPARFEPGQVAALAVTARRIAGDATALACLLEAAVRKAAEKRGAA